MKKQLSLLFTLLVFATYAQETEGKIIGLHFTQGNLQLAHSTIATGELELLGNGPFSADIFTQGVADFDPYSKRYFFTRGFPMKIYTVDGLTGSVISSPTVQNPNDAVSPITNIAYNWLDNTLYGVMHEYAPPINPYDYNDFGQTLLSLVKVDLSTGELVIISEEPISDESYQSGNSDIDPINRIYYYATPERIYGVDLDTGEAIYESDIDYPNSNSQFVVNLAYNYVDELVYGLLFSTTPTAALRLASIDPSSGSISVISDEAISSDGFSVGDCDIDPVNGLFYYIRQNALYQVDLITGEATNVTTIDNPSNAIAPIINMAIDDFVNMPTSSLSMEMGELLYMESGNTMELNAWVGDEDVSYAWSNGSTTPTIQVSEPGQYSVTIQKLGLTIEGSVEVVFGVGINEEQASGVLVYPNPTRDFLYFKSPSNDNLNIEILDLMGRIAASAVLAPNRSFDTRSLTPGVYLVRMGLNGGFSTQKIVIE